MQKKWFTSRSSRRIATSTKECKQTFGGGGHGSYHGGFTPGYHGGYHGHHGSYGGSSFDPNSASYKQRNWAYSWNDNR